MINSLSFCAKKKNILIIGGDTPIRETVYQAVKDTLQGEDQQTANIALGKPETARKALRSKMKFDLVVDSTDQTLQQDISAGNLSGLKRMAAEALYRED